MLHNLSQFVRSVHKARIVAEAMTSIAISVARMDTSRMGAGTFIQTLCLASSRSNAIATRRKIKKKITNNHKKDLAPNTRYRLRRRSLLPAVKQSNSQTVKQSNGQTVKLSDSSEGAWGRSLRPQISGCGGGLCYLYKRSDGQMVMGVLRGDL